MEKIYKYIEDHVTPQGEALDWVEKQTHIRTNHARMLSGHLRYPQSAQYKYVQNCGYLLFRQYHHRPY